MRVGLRAICLLFCLAVPSAEPATPRLQQTPTVFRSVVDYVRLDVVVTDKDDRPVPDLTAEDFEITEGGRPQSIADFQTMAAPSIRNSGPAETEVVNPDVVTNAAPATNSRLFVMVIDDVHIIESELLHVKHIMNDFFAALSPEDEVAVVFVSHSNLSRNFTSNRNLLLKTEDKLRGALGFGFNALGRSGSGDPYGDPRAVFAAARTADEVLKNVAWSLQGSQHPRRAIVYVTSGSVAPSTVDSNGRYPDDFAYLQDVYETARRADEPIYTIDPRGMPQPADAVRGGGGSVGKTNDDAVQQRGLIVANIHQQQRRLAEIAINTGGRAFTNQSDLTRAVGEIMADNSSYYLLGYYPNPFTADGKLHPVSVTVKRPGLRVRARQGYVASVAAGSASSNPRLVLNAALKTGVNVSALQLRALATPLVPGVAGMKTAITVEVSYPHPADGTNQIDDEALLSVVALDPNAKIKASSDHVLKFNGAAPNQDSFTFLINDLMDLHSQKLTVRVGVVSRALGKAGTVQIDLDVPKPSDGCVQLSGIAIGLSGPTPPALNAAALIGLLPFQPLTQRTFSPDETLRVFGSAFWKSKKAPVVTVGIASEPASLKTPTLKNMPAAGNLQQGVFDVGVPLRGLRPGRYVLEVTGQGEDGKNVRRQVPISVR